MQQLAKFQGEIDQSAEIPQTKKTICVRTLLPKESKYLENAVGLFVQYKEQVYLASPTAQVPETTTLVKNEQGQICGIPAVTGG